MITKPNYYILICITFLSLFSISINFLSGQEKLDFGYIEFPSSVNPAYQPLFIKGVLLLHNFQYADAQKTFIELQQKDPNFSLGYWGEAMTYNHPLWDEQDLERGQQALNKFASTPQERIAKAKTPKEKALMNSVNILYGTGDKKYRDYLYAVVLRDLYDQFPEDNEVASFFALALLGKEQGVRDFRQYMQAASIANDVFIKNPRHPGAMHYLIHSVDDPIHAPLGLNAARAYDVIAPDAAHAAHMPSHIFLALGLWDEVIKSNERAWKSGLKSMVGQKKTNDIHDLHSLQWLHYGYLEAGEIDKANELLKLMYQMTATGNDPQFKWYYAQMRATQVTSTKQYEKITPAIEMKDAELSAIASDYFANALISLYKDKKDITPLIDELKNILNSQKTQLENQKEPGKDYFTGIHKEGLAAAQIIILQMIALNQRAKGEKKQAYETIREAVAFQDNATLGYGPPIPPKPSKEILGEFLFEDQQFQEACRTFQEVLLVLPNRKESLEMLNKIDPNFRCPKRENIFLHRLLKK